jgi:hypothetical protein
MGPRLVAVGPLGPAAVQAAVSTAPADRSSARAVRTSAASPQRVARAAVAVRRAAVKTAGAASLGREVQAPAARREGAVRVGLAARSVARRVPEVRVEK